MNLGDFGWAIGLFERFWRPMSANSGVFYRYVGASTVEPNKPLHIVRRAGEADFGLAAGQADGARGD